MGKSSKKLELSRETLLQLDDNDLAGVAGGGHCGGADGLIASVVCNSGVCNSVVCNSGVLCLSAVCL